MGAEIKCWPNWMESLLSSMRSGQIELMLFLQTG